MTLGFMAVLTSLIQTEPKQFESTMTMNSFEMLKCRMKDEELRAVTKTGDITGSRLIR